MEYSGTTNNNEYIMMSQSQINEYCRHLECENIEIKREIFFIYNQVKIGADMLEIMDDVIKRLGLDKPTKDRF